MTREEAIETLKANYPDACYEQLREAVDTAIEALKAQPNLQPTCNNLATDTISRQAAIDAVNTALFPKINTAKDAEKALRNLPSAQPEVIRCKDCRKHNISVGYKEDCCALFEWRGVSCGHEHDYQYCCHAERRTDGNGRD